MVSSQLVLNSAALGQWGPYCKCAVKICTKRKPRELVTKRRRGLPETASSESNGIHRRGWRRGHVRAMGQRWCWRWGQLLGDVKMGMGWDGMGWWGAM
jgi:hypothetical protein